MISLDTAYVSHDGGGGGGGGRGGGGGGRGKKANKPVSADTLQRRAAAKTLFDSLSTQNEAQQWEKLLDMKNSGDKSALVSLMLARSCGDAPPWRVRPGRRAVGRNSRSPQVGPGTPC